VPAHLDAGLGAAATLICRIRRCTVRSEVPSWLATVLSVSPASSNARIWRSSASGSAGRTSATVPATGSAFSGYACDQAISK
jgi:hypothetical protein